MRWFPILMVFLGALGAVTATALDPFAYRDRGDRYEGFKSKPVSGHDIELLGAEAELPESTLPELPENLAVRFFLERSEEVYITVRERDPVEFYWLDKVRPSRPWGSKVTNVFTWPSSEVLRPLGLKASDLVVLARLGRDTPGGKERVAPVIFHPATGSQRIIAYRFTFKTNGSAKIRHHLYGPTSDKALLTSSEHRHSADIPFDVRWQAGAQPEGYYRLRLEGYFLNDNTRIAQEVEFFHTPTWPQ